MPVVNPPLNENAKTTRPAPSPPPVADTPPSPDVPPQAAPAPADAEKLQPVKTVKLGQVPDAAAPAPPAQDPKPDPEGDPPYFVVTHHCVGNWQKGDKLSADELSEASIKRLLSLGAIAPLPDPTPAEEAPVAEPAAEDATKDEAPESK